MGSKRREGRQKENGFREKPCITEIFTFYQKGFVIGVKKKKNWILFNPVSNFPNREIFYTINFELSYFSIESE